MTEVRTDELELGTVRSVHAGGGGSPVVLLHGAGLDNAELSWAHVLPALARHHRVHAPDWPKHGGSWPWRGRADQAGLEDCLSTLLDRWGLDTVTLVGLSMGGSAALGFTLRHPERVSRLVLVGCGGLQQRVAWHRLSYLAVQPPFPRLTGLCLTRGVLRSAIRRSTFASPVADVDDVAEGVHRELRAKQDGSPYSDWQRYSIGWRAMRVDHTPRLGEISCPTLLVHGGADTFVPVDRARMAAERIPGARLRIVEGCGHWVPRERPQELITAVEGFLEE
jgi:pimeloyl-ACP methyl ester carboxylesterase